MIIKTIISIIIYQQYYFEDVNNELNYIKN